MFVDDPRFERTFSDLEWQSLDREPRLEALQRRLFSKGKRFLSGCLKSILTARTRYRLWQIGTGFIASGMRRHHFIGELAGFRRADLHKLRPYRNTQAGL